MATISLTRSGNGLVLHHGDLKLGLDAGLSDGITLLSHSHSDHTSSLTNASEVVATRGTVDTYRARGGKHPFKLALMEYGSTILHEGAMITAVNAGHVLGSTMFLIELETGLTVLYTGDFNVVDSLVHEAARPLKADVLITEATYGKPEWVFPERQSIYNRVLTEATAAVESGQIPRFKAYSLGKAQEAMAVLQGGGFKVVSGNSVIDDVSAVYRRHGVNLSFTSLTDAISLDAFDDRCAIVTSSPNHTNKTFMSIIGQQRAMQLENRIVDYHLSGWALTELSSSGIPLSAHSDFNGLVDFARKVNPRIAYIFNGYNTAFAAHLSELGIHAVPVM